MSFLEEYTKKQQTPESNNSGVIVEIKLKPKDVGKSFLNVLSRIFGKKSEPVVYGNTHGEQLTRTAFNELATKLSKNMLSSKKKQDIAYVKNMYKADIKDPASLGNLKNIVSSNVFHLNNGGKIYLTTTEDDDGIQHYYVSVDNIKKSDNFFVEKFGKTYELYLITKRAIKKRKPISKIEEPDEIDEPINLDVMGEPEDIVMKSDSPKQTIDKPKDKYGVINMDDITYDNIVDMWGDGKVGTGFYRNNYKYKNMIKRTPFQNNWGSGFKYNIGGDDIYLLKNKDNSENAKLLFKGHTPFIKMKEMDMLPWFKEGTKFNWEIININNM